MRRVEVSLGARSYEIHISPGCFDGLADALADVTRRRRVAIITDTRVMALYGAAVQGALAGAGFVVGTFVMGRGEGAKTLRTCDRAWRWLLEHEYGRSETVVLGLGGGVVGDVAGFVASAWLRGVALVQVPTTVLAQVDSSVGGKTGVNLGSAKNMVGSFHQPRMVWAGLGTLKTLRGRDFRSGLAEVVKHGVLGRPEILGTLASAQAGTLRGDEAAMGGLVAACCEVKREVVQADEREAGVRKILNLGHTFGHAIEGVTGHKKRHGEAVAYGIVAACRVSERLGLCGSEITQAVCEVLEGCGLDTEIGPYWNKEVVQRMRTDKKTRGDIVDFVGVKGLGDVSVVPLSLDELVLMVRA